jgi:hypothetical protein
MNKKTSIPRWVVLLAVVAAIYFLFLRNGRSSRGRR